MKLKVVIFGLFALVISAVSVPTAEAVCDNVNGTFDVTARVHPNVSCGTSTGISVNADVRIDAYAPIPPPLAFQTTIGNGVTILSGSRIGKGVTIGNGCNIGPNATVGDDAVLGIDCNLGDGSRVDDDAVLGANVTLATDSRIKSGIVVPMNVEILPDQVIHTQTDADTLATFVTFQISIDGIPLFFTPPQIFTRNAAISTQDLSGVIRFSAAPCGPPSQCLNAAGVNRFNLNAPLDTVLITSTTVVQIEIASRSQLLAPGTAASCAFMELNPDGSLRIISAPMNLATQLIGIPHNIIIEPSVTSEPLILVILCRLSTSFGFS